MIFCIYRANFRAKADEAFKDFVARYFVDGASVVYAKASEQGGFVVSAHMSASRVNLANRWYV